MLSFEPVRYGWRKEVPEDRKAWPNRSFRDLHIKYDCPLLLIKEESIVKCPNLKEIGFQRIRDPYSVFQEISMYISGVMAQKQCPMVTISDKSKIEKHGFDYKWSFRTRKKV